MVLYLYFPSSGWCVCLVYINNFYEYFISHKVLFQEHGVVCCTFHPMLFMLVEWKSDKLKVIEINVIAPCVML